MSRDPRARFLVRVWWILVVIIIICTLGVLMSSCSRPPTESRTVRDSTYVRYTPVNIPVSGNKVEYTLPQVKFVELQQQYLRGEIPRIYVQTQKEGATQLKTSTDLKTGEVKCECETLEQMVKAQQKEIYRLQEIRIKELQQPERKNLFDRVRAWFNTNFLIIFLLLALVYVARRLWPVVLKRWLPKK